MSTREARNSPVFNSKEIASCLKKLQERFKNYQNTEPELTGLNGYHINPAQYLSPPYPPFLDQGYSRDALF